MTDNGNDLEGLFAAARRDAPVASGDLMARVLGDAYAMQPETVVRIVPVRRAWWRVLLAAVGGWPAVSGLVTATLVGVWIGASGTASLGERAADLLGDEAAMYLADLEPLGGFSQIEG